MSSDNISFFMKKVYMYQTLLAKKD